ncbi:MAG: flagellar motor switch protein FliG [Deltaproteobacteria bacterium]|nr:flagellar motor switch protein FliG [Deltaproteobacteria bacterium]
MGALAGKDKAAVFILGLDRNVAAAILKQLDDDEIAELRAACEALDPKAMSASREVFDEFKSAVSAPQHSSPRYVRDLINSAVGPDRARRILSGEKPNRLAIVEQLDPRLAAELLEREHPQAVAALLYHLDDAVAGRILKNLSKDRVTDVVRRVAALSNVSEEALAQIERTLAATLGEQSPEQDKVNGVSKAATLVNYLDTELATKVIDGITETDKDLGKRVRDARFTIEDVAKADARGLQLVLREIESDKLLLALKTASDLVREKLLSCVSSRVADSLREELAVMGPVRVKDVEDAQKRIVEVALQLQKEGKLLIAGAQGDDFV